MRLLGRLCEDCRWRPQLSGASVASFLTLTALTITSHACSAPRRVSLNVLASITGLAAGPPGPPRGALSFAMSAPQSRPGGAAEGGAARRCHRHSCLVRAPVETASMDTRKRESESVRVPNARMSRIYACLPDEDRVWDLAFTLLKLQQLESQPFSLP